MGLDDALEARPLMRTVAERFALRHATAAQPDFCAPCKAVGFAFLIDNLYFPVYKQRAIINDGHFNVRHSILRS
jgi:hypothetical protein